MIRQVEIEKLRDDLRSSHVDFECNKFRMRGGVFGRGKTNPNFFEFYRIRIRFPAHKIQLAYLSVISALQSLQESVLRQYSRHTIAAHVSYGVCVHQPMKTHCNTRGGAKVEPQYLEAPNFIINLASARLSLRVLF